MINEQISEINKKYKSSHTRQTILPIPKIFHFYGTSILAELGDISNYSIARIIIKVVGVASYHYESSQCLTRL